MSHPKDPDYPKPSSKAITAVMKANRRSNTKPEILVRSMLHKLGYRFRKDYPIRLGKRSCRPDIVFTKKKKAIFLDGCFWHYCPKHGHMPKLNIDYWRKKFKANRERDKLDNFKLKEAGWGVIRIWEHTPIEEAIGIIIKGINESH